MASEAKLILLKLAFQKPINFTRHLKNKEKYDVDSPTHIHSKVFKEINKKLQNTYWKLPKAICWLYYGFTPEES